MEQTAIEYLINRLAENGIIHSSDIYKAKEMEKEQRKKDYRAGWNDNKHKDWNCEFYLEKHLTGFETTKNEKI